MSTLARQRFPQYFDPKCKALRPTQYDITRSWCLYVTCEFKFDHGIEGLPTNFDQFRAHAKTGAFKPWSFAKGLRNKVFWLHEDSNTTGGFYTFFTREHIDAYMKTELFGMMNHIPFLKNV
jgi:hypothetical protein